MPIDVGAEWLDVFGLGAGELLLEPVQRLEGGAGAEIVNRGLLGLPCAPPSRGSSLDASKQKGLSVPRGPSLKSWPSCSIARSVASISTGAIISGAADCSMSSFRSS